MNYQVCLYFWVSDKDPAITIIFIFYHHSDWVTNQHRDTYASHVAHYDQLSYYAVAQNESIGRVRLQFLDKMIQPCGP